MAVYRGRYSEGFAPRDFQSRYSELWKGCTGAWCPSLGSTGQNLYDWSGFKGNGAATSITSVLLWPQPIQGAQMLSLDGTGYVTCGSPPGFAGGSYATLCGWIYRSSTGTTVGFGGAFDTGSNVFSFIWYSDGNLYCTCSNTTSANGLVALAGTGLHHVTAVFDGSKSTNATRLLVYVDGKPQTLSFGGTIPATLSTVGPIIIGKDISNRLSAGSYDDVRTYNRPLNPNEVWLLSRRRGIAYEYERRRMWWAVSTSGNRRRRILCAGRSM